MLGLGELALDVAQVDLVPVADVEQHQQQQPGALVGVDALQALVDEGVDGQIVPYGNRHEHVLLGQEQKRKRMGIVLHNIRALGVHGIFDARAVHDDERLARVVVVVDVRPLLVVEGRRHKLGDNAQLVAEPLALVVGRRNYANPAPGFGFRDLLRAVGSRLEALDHNTLLRLCIGCKQAPL